ncbi:MAG: hypothetical protein JSV52_10345 [Candidatus Zixiibacteriota bacterium]|nr:MAG: hypothetical protein JSV52_10345 [candidate division Zixibacteria bacterium]
MKIARLLTLCLLLLLVFCFFAVPASADQGNKQGSVTLEGAVEDPGNSGPPHNDDGASGNPPHGDDWSRKDKPSNGNWGSGQHPNGPMSTGGTGYVLMVFSVLNAL